MSEAAKVPHRPQLQLIGAIVGTAALLNVAFWVMSSVYVKDKPQVALELSSIRMAFATLSIVVAVMSFVASLAPRLIGHGLAVLASIALIVGGKGAVRGTLPVVLGFSMVGTGLVTQALVWRSMLGSRGGWSFLIAILSVLAVITFFGAPKIRHELGIGLWHTLIIPGVMIVAVIALATLRSEYRAKA